MHFSVRLVSVRCQTKDGDYYVSIDTVIFRSYLHPQHGGCMYLRMLPSILLTTRLHNPDYNDMNYW